MIVFPCYTKNGLFSPNRKLQPILLLVIEEGMPPLELPTVAVLEQEHFPSCPHFTVREIWQPLYPPLPSPRKPWSSLQTQGLMGFHFLTYFAAALSGISGHKTRSGHAMAEGVLPFPQGTPCIACRLHCTMFDGASWSHMSW